MFVRKDRAATVGGFAKGIEVYLVVWFDIQLDLLARQCPHPIAVRQSYVPLSFLWRPHIAVCRLQNKRDGSPVGR